MCSHFHKMTRWVNPIININILFLLCTFFKDIFLRVYLGVHDNQILLHFSVPDKQIILRFGVSHNQIVLHFGVPNNCSMNISSQTCLGH
jgi:hypothetical protein